MIFLLGLIAALFIPILIVVLWRKRPIVSFIVASLVAFLTVITPMIMKIFQAMVIYGEGDPQLMAGMISVAIVNATLSLIIILPILFIIQRIALRRSANKAARDPAVFD